MPENNFNHYFGVILKQFRNREGLTQQQLCELTNIQRGYISDLECGRKGISLEKFIQLSSGFSHLAQKQLFEAVVSCVENHED